MHVELLRDILNGLLVSFTEADSCQDRRTLVVYTVGDPGFAPGSLEKKRETSHFVRKMALLELKRAHSIQKGP